MPPSSPYQRFIYQGVPYWKTSDGTLYYYDSIVPPTEATRIAIGTETTGLNPDWQHLLETTLISYRASQKSRTRAPTNASTSRSA
jgi:hypothetical protein